MTQRVAPAGLVCCEQVLAPVLCGQVMRELEAPSFRWQPAEVHSGSPESAVKPGRTALVAVADPNPDMVDMVEAIDSFLADNELVQELRLRRSSINILNYGIGGRYVAHRDAGPAHPKRLLSLLTYLNDDFEGGATWFPATDTEIRPVVGMGVLFDSALLHSGEPVLSGRKYALVTWLRQLS